jgi:hypothetical protein
MNRFDKLLLLFVIFFHISNFKHFVLIEKIYQKLVNLGIQKTRKFIISLRIKFESEKGPKLA